MCYTPINYKYITDKKHSFIDLGHKFGMVLGMYLTETMKDFITRQKKGEFFIMSVTPAKRNETLNKLSSKIVPESHISLFTQTKKNHTFL